MSQFHLTEVEKKKINIILTDHCYQEIDFNGDIWQKILTEKWYEDIRFLIDSAMKKEKAEAYKAWWFEWKRAMNN